jgi:hypothetical protein
VDNYDYAENGEFRPRTRWAAWERAVLARLETPKELQDLILDRQRELDDDDSEAQLVADFFRESLLLHGGDPERDRVFIPNSYALDWVNRALGESQPKNRASTKLKNLGVPELQRDFAKDARGHGCRGWLWTGALATSGTRKKRFQSGPNLGLQYMDNESGNAETTE